MKKVGMKKFLGSFGKNNILFVNNMESVLTRMNWKACGYDYRSSFQDGRTPEVTWISLETKT